MMSTEQLIIKTSEVRVHKMSKIQPLDSENLFATKLDQLFHRIRKPDGKTFSYGDVAKGIQEEGEPTINAGYIWKLRTGVIKNPGYRVIKAIARFFDVPVSYFFEEEEAETERLEEINLARQLKDSPQVQKIALRASDLEDAEQEAVLAMIRAIQKAKGAEEEEE
jgi:transcriptional regulator with XRE-family HTH domain